MAGMTKEYSSQILSFGLWVLFGINLAGGVALLIVNLLLFSTLILWISAAVLIAIALFVLIWALIIRKQNKAFQNVRTESTADPK